MGLRVGYCLFVGHGNLFDDIKLLILA